METEPIEESEEIVKLIFAELIKSETLKNLQWEKPKIYVIGLAVWDIFSNNNEVISQRNKWLDIGSWRGSGSTISRIIYHNFNESGKEDYNYLDFYMGSEYILSKREPINEVYKEIFILFKKLNYDWQYSKSNKWTEIGESEIPAILESYKSIFRELPKETD